MKGPLVENLKNEIITFYVNIAFIAASFPIISEQNLLFSQY